MRLIKSLIISALAIIAADSLLKGFYVEDFKTAIIASIILGILSYTIIPILRILTFPLTLLTFGLFALVVNAIAISLTAKIVKGVYTDGLLTSILASFIIAITQSILTNLFNEKKRKEKRRR